MCVCMCVCEWEYNSPLSPFLPSLNSFRELLQLSNACINNALKEARDMFKVTPLPIPSSSSFSSLLSSHLLSIYTLIHTQLPGLTNPSLMALCIDLLMEVAMLMKRFVSLKLTHIALRCSHLISSCVLSSRNNDFSEGINDPTLRKLEKFNREYEKKEAEKARRGKGGGGGGFLSFLWGGSRK